MGLGCGGTMGKIFLIGINIIFFVLGLGLLIVGALMKANVKIIKEELKPALNSVTVSSYKLGDLTDNLSIVFIAIGVFIFLVAGLGLFGACCQNRCMLVTYAILVLILLIIKIVAIALWFTMKGEVEDKVREEMLKSLNGHYTSNMLDSDNEISNSWNYMFLTLDCCAVNPVTGVANDFKQTPWCTTAGTCQQSNADLPGTCCTGVDANTYRTAPSDCTSAISGYNTMGCYDALKDEINSYSTPIIGVGVTILIIELLAVIFAFVICKQSGQDEVV
ncbi:tetraspanin-9-like [Ostrea edulis]|uniref:tetraspanin-9-like n=1 Tax=Ostrea edulis TaxID=37623 RepID=UPI0024AEC052|nr:tetraspanin-9-like [Ostrea edulis]XP_056012428.1 tetraspanin-9-like [Ostrea edulis]XP_056012429.1 tetraspanin-9-like [Ostrea edulis]